MRHPMPSLMKRFALGSANPSEVRLPARAVHAVHAAAAKTFAFRAIALIAAALSMQACDLALLQKEESDAQQPATESTVIGIWRSNIPTGKAPPEPTDIKVTLDIEPDHTMLLSKRIATGRAAPFDYCELVKEYWSWSVADGKLSATKTDCTYKNPETMEVVSTDCAEPKSESVTIDVKGAAWTMDETGTPLIYRKD
jgi:hypothetical protein